MPTVIAHHEVEDTDHWLSSPKREEFFGALGITNIRTFVDPQNRQRVAVVFDAPDMDALMAGLETDDGAAAMEHDGVKAETLVMLVES
jgi:intracellular sulfur oxidation DsrE/DsrF family protein